MKYTFSEAAKLLNIPINELKKAARYGLVSVDYDPDKDVEVVAYDNLFVAYQKYLDDAEKYTGKRTLPAYKYMAGKRIKIVNKISIFCRNYNGKFIYVARYPNHKQAVFFNYEDAFNHCKHDTRMLKRSSSINYTGITPVSLTYYELDTLIRTLPRNNFTDRLIDKLKSHLLKLKRNERKIPTFKRNNTDEGEPSQD
jgi:hypothetical protein